jgi:hypothetical protein
MKQAIWFAYYLGERFLERQSTDKTWPKKYKFCNHCVQTGHNEVPCDCFFAAKNKKRKKSVYPSYEYVFLDYSYTACNHVWNEIFSLMGLNN